VRQVNLHEAKTHLSRLVAEAVAGQGFVICKAGKPLVQVTRLTGAEDAATPPRRRLGLLAGQCSVPDDFDQIAAETRLSARNRPRGMVDRPKAKPAKPRMPCG
jgi:antitoxin (DNA-binding transcriptional repressor) of toxin-antitoxin stability system